MKFTTAVIEPALFEKATAILLDPRHWAHWRMVDLCKSALEVDEPEGYVADWIDPDPTPAHGIPRHLTVVTP